MGRPTVELVLSQAELEQLQTWSRRRKTAQALAVRARIILLCAEGLSNNEVAARYAISKQMVCKWRSRFVASRLDGLLDAPRPGQPRKITDASVEEVIDRTLHHKPGKSTHWSTRSLAAATGLTQNAIFRIWKTFGLQPHRQETFKLSSDLRLRALLG
jgi:transposase